MNLELQITKVDDHYCFILTGLASGPVESRQSAEHNKSIELIRRWLKNEINEKDLEQLGLFNCDTMFIAQLNKEALSAIASFIYKNILPEKISSFLKNQEIEYLSLIIDDSLVDIPWELMNDGRDFFCMKYAIGRKVTFEKQKNVNPQPDHILNFLLIEDPTGTLPASKNEVNYLMGGLLGLPGVKVRRSGMEMRKKDFLNTLRNSNFDILHFSGHGYFDSNKPNDSYLLFYDYDNPCYAHEIAKNLVNQAPVLIFSNACTSAQAIVGQQGLAYALLSCGTSAYIGSIWPVTDELAGMIGAEFYRYLIYGKTIGEALRLARLNSHKKFGWTSISWSAYILYDDPALRISHLK